MRQGHPFTGTGARRLVEAQNDQPFIKPLNRHIQPFTLRADFPSLPHAHSRWRGMFAAFAAQRHPGQQPLKAAGGYRRDGFCEGHGSLCESRRNRTSRTRKVSCQLKDICQSRFRALFSIADGKARRPRRRHPHPAAGDIPAVRNEAAPRRRPAPPRNWDNGRYPQARPQRRHFHSTAQEAAAARIHKVRRRQIPASRP